MVTALRYHVAIIPQTGGVERFAFLSPRSAAIIAPR
jgi:hypothetical protein